MPAPVDADSRQLPTVDDFLVRPPPQMTHPLSTVIAGRVPATHCADPTGGTMGGRASVPRLSGSFGWTRRMALILLGFKHLPVIWTRAETTPCATTIASCTGF